MKRRKKIWIACAALAVVVVLSAFALHYRPVPYEFLRDAIPVSAGSNIVERSWGPVRYLSIQRFLIDDSLASVADRSMNELTTEDGWEWRGSISDGKIEGYSSAKNQVVELIATPTEHNYVSVSTTRPANFLEGAYHWLLAR